MKEIYLPALRGIFGDWVYYSCLINISDLANHVDFADDIHKSEQLSKLIQRELKGKRSKEIVEYLKTEEQKFLSSLVIAVYGGEPQWYEASIQPVGDSINRQSISEDALSSVGFLRLSGREKLFALDGQHRLSGIKLAVKQEVDISDAEVNILLVSHKKTTKGLERTRRLFTTLNKKAIRVSKGEIIALDEDDLMAIIVRKLVEDNKLFKDDRIVFKHTNNISPKDTKSLTTVGNLYDILGIIFEKLKDEKISELKSGQRPDDKKIDEYYDLTCQFFDDLSASFPVLQKYFNSKNEEKIVQANRGSFGGNILFRPVGLSMVIEIICNLAGEFGIESAFKRIKKIPLNLDEEPYKYVIWNPDRSIMVLRGRTVVRDKLLMQFGLIKDKKKIDQIDKKYREFSGR